MSDDPRERRSEQDGPPAGRLRGEFVSDPIKVDVDTLSTGVLSRGEPSCPGLFWWRGARYDVENILEKWRRLAEDQGETYVRAHCFRVQTSQGIVAVLSCDRRFRRGRNPWRILTVERP